MANSPFQLPTKHFIIWFERYLVIPCEINKFILFLPRVSTVNVDTNSHIQASTADGGQLHSIWSYPQQRWRHHSVSRISGKSFGFRITTRNWPIAAFGLHCHGGNWQDDRLFVFFVQGIKRLYSSKDIDRKKELRKLNHSILVNFLDLIDILIKVREPETKKFGRLRFVVLYGLMTVNIDVTRS